MLADVDVFRLLFRINSQKTISKHGCKINNRPFFLKRISFQTLKLLTEMMESRYNDESIELFHNRHSREGGNLERRRIKFLAHIQVVVVQRVKKIQSLDPRLRGGDEVFCLV